MNPKYLKPHFKFNANKKQKFKYCNTIITCFNLFLYSQSYIVLENQYGSRIIKKKKAQILVITSVYSTERQFRSLCFTWVTCRWSRVRFDKIRNRKYKDPNAIRNARKRLYPAVCFVFLSFLDVKR